MNRMLTIAAVMLAATTWLAADVADAKRLGGGRSFGAQRQMTPAPSTPNATPSAPNAAPSQSMAPRTATPATPAAAPSGMSRWLGPIAGLAAGLGLAALLSHFGLSESFASFMLLALLVVGGIFLVRFFLARRNAPSPLQYAGPSPDRVEPRMARAASEPVMSSATSAPAASRFPPGFDAVAFAEQAKEQFRKLQAAYDTADRQGLADVMTPEMFAEVSGDLAKRTSHEATMIDRLDAEVLGVATEGRQHWMSVRFTGLLREDGTLLPKEFDETWNLVKPVDGSSGWMLAGIQQAHEMA
jgi:predicted lipid-binding transport protein (Tim44 family)